MHPIRSWAFAAALLLGAAASQAALLARDLTGDGVTDAYYDDVLDITWLRDWNYAFHVGYDADGRMTWHQAVQWAQDLDFGGYTDWRLPRVVDSGTQGCTQSYGGGIETDGFDCGFNVLTKVGGTVYSELAHLFLVTLGDLSYCAPAPLSTQSTCVTPPGWVVHDPQHAYGLAHGGARPFDMPWPEMVWTESEIETAASANKAWTWNTMISDQRPSSEDAEFLAVAVRPGDVGGGDVSEPLPAALALLGLGVAGVARRMRVR